MRLTIIVITIAGFLCGVLVTAALFATAINPLEVTACLTVERYFAAEDDALGRLDSSKLSAIAIGGPLISPSNLIQGRPRDLGPIYKTTSINRCQIRPDFIIPKADKIGLEASYTTKTFAADPRSTAIQPIDVTTLNLLFVVTKYGDTWKVSDIISPQ